MLRPGKIVLCAAQAIGLLFWPGPKLSEGTQIPLEALTLPANKQPAAELSYNQRSRIACGLDVKGFQKGLAGRMQWSLVDVVGGHEGMLTDGKHVLKPMQNSSRGLREAAFYETVESLAEAQPQLRSLFPAYYGVVQSGDEASRLSRAAKNNELPSGASWLKLQDLTAGFNRPCVADVKLGTRTWSPGSSDRKRRKAIARYPHQLVAGYRFTGMRVFTSCEASACLPSNHAAVLKNRKLEGSELQAVSTHNDSQPSDQCVLLHRRQYGRSLGHLHGMQGWLDFLSDGQQVRWECIPALLLQLRDMQTWLRQQRRFEFYSSSLLIVYDADGPADSVVVRLIDFAHAKDMPAAETANPAAQPKGDRGTLVGIQNLIASLEALQAVQGSDKVVSSNVNIVVCEPETEAVQK